EDGRITLWDADTGRPRPALVGHTGFVAAMAFAPDGRTLASSGGDHAVRLWDLAANRERFAIRGQTSTLVGLTFSPDGRLLVLAALVSPFIRLWDVDTGSQRAALRGSTGDVVAVAISPDGTTLAAADFRGVITFWDLATFELRPRRLKHAGVHALAFAP